MSATGRGAVRAGGDYYPTPAWCVTALLDRVELPTGCWLEPCAGSGAIIRAAGRTDVVWTAIEVNPDYREDLKETFSGPIRGAYLVEDFLTCPMPPGQQPYSVCLTNPPYFLAQEFVSHALEWAENVVMLLRLNFLSSQRRRDWLAANVPDVYVLPKRPSFVKGRTDACEYGWLWWKREPQRFGQVHILEVPK